ncbi:hypothetical protein NE578_10130, partial [Schaalia odontolytica]|uniref:hypothetical protein n=1 Tax=Schaalia odontolytica TaxID=1660 RepID=UPI00210C4261
NDASPRWGYQKPNQGRPPLGGHEPYALTECVPCDAISCELTDVLLEMPELGDTDAAIVWISRWLDEHPGAVGVIE